MQTPLQIKASVLSNGIRLTDTLIENYGLPFLEKRRAYGNQDPLELRNVCIPQEIYIDPDNQKLIAAVNVNQESEWKIDFNSGSYFLTNDNLSENYKINFPLRPKFYDYNLQSGQNVSKIITLYGGASLGIFAYGKCHLVEIDKPCQYCSISQNRDKGTDFLKALGKEQIYEAVTLALQDTVTNASQIMLNGGNFEDMDKSFIHYINLLKSIDKAVKDSGKKIDIHIIVYPPKNLELINELEGLDIGIAMNTEVFNSELFEKYCPGKVVTAGREHILNALQKAVDVLGKGKVFSILVGGLEPVNSLSEGINLLAEKGITPIVNVLHTDPETPLENFPNPTPEIIFEMGSALQKVFKKHNLKPFYENCGRNSIDTEAYKELFN